MVGRLWAGGGDGDVNVVMMEKHDDNVCLRKLCQHSIETIIIIKHFICIIYSFI